MAYIIDKAKDLKAHTSGIVDVSLITSNLKDGKFFGDEKALTKRSKLYEIKLPTDSFVKIKSKLKAKDTAKINVDMGDGFVLRLLKTGKTSAGSGGSGGGSDDTAINESLQCYYCSYVFNVAKKQVDNVTFEQLNKPGCTSYADTNVSLAKAYKGAPESWFDEKIYIRTANILYKTYKNKFRGKVYFHRGSPFMAGLYSAKAHVQKLDKKSDKPLAPGSFNDDKWNPGDIWMSTLSKHERPLANIDTFDELNKKVLQMADDGICLGVSLKRLESREKIEEFNRTKLSDKSWKTWSWGKTGDFFSSQDIYVTMSNKLVQFRTFSGDTSWQGEIKGLAAAGGKIGGGNVNFFVNKIFSTPIYDTEANFLKSIKDDDVAYDYLYEGYVRHNKNSTPKKSVLTKDEFMNEVQGQDRNFINSKAICIAFLDAVYAGNAQKRTELANSMFGYASSATDVSSFFIKVS